MVNNFELIKPLLEFPDDDTFYHLQVIRRGKDHPEMASANRTIQSYYICKLESIDALREEIITLCEAFNARAYINLSPKSIRKCTLLQLKYITQRMYDTDYKKIWKAWSTCAGEIGSKKPRWIIDLDDDNASDDKINEIRGFINGLEPDVGDKVIERVPTKSGIHLITKPFRLDMFQERYPDIDTHKNNPTILYVP